MTIQFPVCRLPLHMDFYHGLLMSNMRYTALSDIYSAAIQALQSDSETHRMTFHMEALVQDAFPLLLAFDDGIDNYPTLSQWLEQTATIAYRRKLHAVNIERSGKRGRPRKVPIYEVLKDAFASHRGISQSEMADVLGIHRNTLSRYLKQYNINSHKFSNISDSDLDTIVRDFRVHHPQAGVRYLRSHLRNNHSLRIQRLRVQESIDRVDPLGQVLRHYTATRRRRYKVSRPNALWHMDGHHKLIKWGLLFMASLMDFVERCDNSQRIIVGLRASTSNSASTVLDVFIKAVERYDLPSRVRGDRGGENKKVSVYMILRHGLNRASYMWGK
ncbi:hypothetical protein D9758_015069 [Tetrapyrgos nigripes]|uniref:HTH cro/C1-type domain-containing protein n=1 Tax=Tetrapyrgos nigripes TaxID=182062 RepID=A0A8H5CT55_9AGAR|nr:hypothetical protein D9758_015069 [Tetrapyrgos nigripes]